MYYISRNLQHANEAEKSEIILGEGGKKCQVY